MTKKRVAVLKKRLAQVKAELAKVRPQIKTAERAYEQRVQVAVRSSDVQEQADWRLLSVLEMLTENLKWISKYVAETYDPKTKALYKAYRKLDDRETDLVDLEDGLEGRLEDAS